MMNYVALILVSQVLPPFLNKTSKGDTVTMYKSSSYSGSRLKNNPNQHYDALWIIDAMKRIKSIIIIE